MADLRDALFGTDTLRLGEAMDGGKVVVVNLYRFGEAEERATVGRLFVGLVAALGQRRGRMPDNTRHRPVHLMIDEATEVASPQMVVILEQLRKYGIHLTLAQQVGGRKFTAEQKEVLFQNTRTKIIAHLDKREGAALLGFQGDPNTLPKLDDQQFWVSWHGDDAVRHLAVRNDLADWSHRVPEDEWQRFSAAAVAAYYRPAKPEPPAPAARPAPPSPADTAPAPSATPAKPQPKRSTLGLLPKPAGSAVKGERKPKL